MRRSGAKTKRRVCNLSRGFSMLTTSHSNGGGEWETRPAFARPRKGEEERWRCDAKKIAPAPQGVRPEISDANNITTQRQTK